MPEPVGAALNVSVSAVVLIAVTVVSNVISAAVITDPTVIPVKLDTFVTVLLPELVVAVKLALIAGL